MYALLRMFLAELVLILTENWYLFWLNILKKGYITIGMLELGGRQESLSYIRYVQSRSFCCFYSG
jgi:hypothetical protein